MASPPVVLITFAGRRDRMAVLKRYVDEAMRRGSIDEWHVWNCTRTVEDNAWLRENFPLRHTADDRLYRLVRGARIQAADHHVLRFQVRAAHDAHLALIADRHGPSYELVLGGWGNSASALRVWPPGVIPDHTQQPHRTDISHPTPGLMSRRAWRSVEIDIGRCDDRRTISVRVDKKPILQADLPGAEQTGFHVAAMTGYGAEAEWRFPDAASDDDGAWLFEQSLPPNDAPWAAIYHHYVDRADDYADTVFLKCDDDIVYFDLDKLDEFIRFRRENPDYFLVSASVVNNGVCAYVQQRRGMIPESLIRLEMPPNGSRGTLWESGSAAEKVHSWFLADPSHFQTSTPDVVISEARLSINFVSWLGADLCHFDTRLADDEHELSLGLPRFLERQTVIYLPFVASHLSFREQDPQMDTAGLIEAYQHLADTALAIKRPIAA